MHIAGPVQGKVVLVQGGAGPVGQCAIGLARHAGASVIASVRSERDADTAKRAGAHHVVVLKGSPLRRLLKASSFMRRTASITLLRLPSITKSVSYERLLRLGGSIATYATGDPQPTIPFWPLVFKNISLFFLGSDDFPADAKAAAANAINEALQREWSGFEIGARLPLESIAAAHELVEAGMTAGRVVLTLEGNERTA